MTVLDSDHHIQCYGCNGCSPYVVRVDGVPACPVCESADIDVTVNRPTVENESPSNIPESMFKRL